MIRPPLTQRQFKKEAFWPLLIGIAAILGLGGAAFGLTEAVTGYQENIVNDSEQLRSILTSLVSKYPNNPQIVSSLDQDGQQLAELCQALLAMINQKGQDNSAINDFHTKMGAAEVLIDKIQQEYAQLEQLEAISFSPSVNSHISAVKDGLSKVKSVLEQIGSKNQLQRQDGQGMEMVQTPEGAASTQPPLNAQTSVLDDSEKQKVADFLSQNYQPGTTLRNLPDRLMQISNQITSELGVDNVTPAKLMGANEAEIRGVFWVWKNPGAAAKYKTPSWNT